MPTRLTWVTPPSGPAGERASTHTTAYCSPGAASLGTSMVTVTLAVPRAGTWRDVGSMDVHVDRSFGVRPSAPANAPSSMDAAAGYSTTGVGVAPVEETSR